VIPVVTLHRNMIAGLCRPSRPVIRRVALFITAFLLARTPAVFGIAPEQAVPDFKADDLQGNARTLGEFSGKATVLLFWRPEAERARNAVCEVDGAIYHAYEGTRLVTVVSGEHDRAEIASVLERCSRPVTVLLDRDRSIFAAYQIIALPTLMVLSPELKLKYKEAGFSHEGIARLTGQLDEMYGRKPPAIAVPEGSPEAIRRFGLAMQFFRNGLNERAEELLLQLVGDHPEYRPAWVSLGYCRIALGKVDGSLECLEKAHNLDRRNRDVAAGFAWIWWRKGDRAASEKWAAMVDKNDPNACLITEIQPDPVK
jgi:peroxiredoxin